MSNTYYLNNDGSRWIERPSPRVHVYLDGFDMGTRAVDYFASFGNFASWHVRINGKRYGGLPEDFERDAEGLAILKFESPVIRTVEFRPFVPGALDYATFTLAVRDTGRKDAMGKRILAYRFSRGTQRHSYALFEGNDFHCSPLHAPESDETLRALIGFITLRPGDTDADYFESYNIDQIAFAKSHACEILAAYGDEDGPNFEDSAA